MPDVSDRSPLTSQPELPGTTRPGLNGASLSLSTLCLVGCTPVGGLLFTITYLIEGATRPDYSAWQQPISALSLGPGGWVQQVNFVVFGIFTLCSALGWRKVLKGGVSAVWYPLSRVFDGSGLVMLGIFSQDPSAGYPPGVAPTSTLHGGIHIIFSLVSLGSVVLGTFVIAPRLASEPRWRGWATFAVISGIMIIVFINLFGAATTQNAGAAGLYERLATGAGAPLSTLLVIRLWRDFRDFRKQLFA